MKISQTEINAIRKTSFRPQIAVCLIHDKKVFMFFDEKYKLWQFPQGGIDNGESIISSIKRELEEELGNNISKNLSTEPILLLFEDKISFPERLWGSRELKLDDGMKMMMKGKYFFYIALETNLNSFDLEDSEFDGQKLLDSKEADIVIDQIYQFNKQRISRKAIAVLKEQGLIS